MAFLSSDKNVITTTDGTEVSIKLAKKPEFEAIDIKDPTKEGETAAITPDGMTVTKVETPDPNEKEKTITTTTKVGAGGTSITREDKTTDPANPTTETAKYGIDGAVINNKDGNSAELGAHGLEVVDTNGNVNNVGADGLEVTDANGNTNNIGADGVEVTDANGNSNSIGADGITTSDQDGNNTVMGATGLEVTNADGNSNNIGADGMTVKGKDGKSDIEIKASTDNDPAKVALKGEDGVTDSVVLKASDGTDGGSVAVGNKDDKETIKLDGGNGTDAPTVTVKNNDGTKDSVTIKGADGKNGPSIDFAKQTEPTSNDKVGTGKITGLANLKDGDDGTSAANKNYVDSKFAELNGDRPFEYTTTETAGDGSTKPVKVVRGQDGKLYKEKDLANKVYVDGVGYVAKDKTELLDGEHTLIEAEKANEAALKTEFEGLRVANDKVSLDAQPKGDGPISVGNVASGLDATKVGAVKDPNADKDDAKEITVETAKELVVGKQGGTKVLNNLDKVSKLNKVATIGDLKTASLAGLDFGANTGDDIHRNLGEKVSIVGKDLKAEVLKSMGIDSVPADDAANKADYDAKLAAAKKAITDGFSAKNVATVIDTGSNEIVINIADKPEFKAISIRDDEFAGKTLDLTPETITMAADGNTNKMGADGLEVKDENGNANNIGADGLDITDASGNVNSIGAAGLELSDEAGNNNNISAESINLLGANGKESNLEAGKLVLIKSAGGGDKPEAHIVLEATDKGGKLTGLENRNTSSEGYGSDVSRAATESAVKKNRDDVDAGVIGPMVYTDNEGNRLVKADDGKYYAAKDVENGKAKTDVKAVENPALSLANGDRTGDTKAPVVLNNVAGGTVSENSHQAVNGAQLHQTNLNVQNNSIRIDNLQNQVNTLDKNMRAGVAQAVAQANLPVNILPGKSTLSLATGHYMGTQAFAVGYSRVSDNGKVSVKFSLGHGGKQTSVGAGVGYSW